VHALNRPVAVIALAAACARLGAPAGAETIIIDMPPPPPGYEPSVVYDVIRPEQSDVDVGTVALTRFARMRQAPADTYFFPPRIFRTYGQFYYNYGPVYGYGPGWGWGWPWWGWWGGGVRYNVHVKHVTPNVNLHIGRH
jgi:hypothetical protein